MQVLKPVCLVGLLLPGALGFVATAANAAYIRTQAPCVTPAGYCRIFSPTGAIPVIRSFSFPAKANSTAQITFHGSILCAVSLASTVKRVVDLAGQIVPTAGATPSQNGPGGFRYDVTVDEYALNVAGSDSFNLAATRVFSYQTAGTKSVYFKLARLRMDTDLTCYVYNAAFSVVVTP